MRFPLSPLVLGLLAVPACDSPGGGGGGGGGFSGFPQGTNEPAEGNGEGGGAGEGETTNPAEGGGEEGSTTRKPGDGVPGGGVPGGGPGDDDPGTTGGDDPADGPAPLCDREGFVAVEAQSEVPGPETLFYAARSSTAAPWDVLLLEVYQSAQYGGPTTPGTYDLAGSNYEDCGLCLRLLAGCTETAGGMDCEKSFYASEGTIEVTALSGAGAPFQGVLHDVVAREVTIDETTFRSTPIDGGESWCLDGVEFSAKVAGDPAAPGPSPGPTGSDPGTSTGQCVKNGTGVLVGSQIADFQLTNCLGEAVSLHASCGKEKAVWLMAVAGWCGACTQVLGSIVNQWGAPLGPSKFPPGLDFKVILYENTYSQKPTLAYCKQYASQHKLDPAMVLVDWSDGETQIPLVSPQGYAIGVHGLATTWSKVNPHIVASPSGSVQTTTPWFAVLRGKDMSYVWSSYADKSKSVDQVLNQVMAE